MAAEGKISNKSGSKKFCEDLEKHFLHFFLPENTIARLLGILCHCTKNHSGMQEQLLNRQNLSILSVLLMKVLTEIDVEREEGREAERKERREGGGLFFFY